MATQKTNERKLTAGHDSWLSTDWTTGLDTLLGEGGNDTLYGDERANTLKGGDGNDVLRGLGGNDQLDGGADNDVLHGGADNDELDGETGNDQLYGGPGNDTLDGGAGNDVLYGGPGRDELDGGGGNDVLYGGPGRDELEGGNGDDVLIVEGGNMYGGPGNDTLIATGGAQVWGGPGADILIGPGYGNVMYIDSPRGVTVDLQNGTGRGGDAQGDMITGFKGIVGSHHNDELKGDESNNFFRGMNGGDKFYGRGGIDMVSFWGKNGNAGATVDLSVPDKEGKGGYAEGDTFVSIENLFGSNHGDNFTGNEETNWLSGQDGDDKLYGRGDWDSLGGGKGDDLLNGGSGADHLSGNEGADTFVFDKDSLPGSTGTLADETDRVWDFSGLGSDGVKQASEDGDKLDLSGLKTAEGITITKIGLLPGKKTDEFSPPTQSSNVEGKVWYWQYEKDTNGDGENEDWTNVAADLTGDGNADFQVELFGHHDLTAADFVGVEAAIG